MANLFKAGRSLPKPKLAIEDAPEAKSDLFKKSSMPKPSMLKADDGPGTTTSTNQFKKRRLNAVHAGY